MFKKKCNEITVYQRVRDGVVELDYIVSDEPVNIRFRTTSFEGRGVSRGYSAPAPKSIADVKPLPETLEEYSTLISRMPKPETMSEVGRRECLRGYLEHKASKDTGVK